MVAEDEEKLPSEPSLSSIEKIKQFFNANPDRLVFVKEVAEETGLTWLVCKGCCFQLVVQGYLKYLETRHGFLFVRIKQGIPLSPKLEEVEIGEKEAR